MARKRMVLQRQVLPAGQNEGLRSYDGQTNEFIRNGPLTGIGGELRIWVGVPVAYVIVQPNGDIVLELGEIKTELV